MQIVKQPNLLVAERARFVCYLVLQQDLLKV